MFKKFLCISLLTSFSFPVLANYSAPQWSEFCPPEYVNAVYNQLPEKITPKKDIILGAVFGVFYSLFKNVETNNQIQTVNYWVDRRAAFDNEINTCIADKNNQSLCFMQVRNIEQQKNIQLKNEQLRATDAVIQSLDNTNAQLQSQQNHRDLNGIESQLNTLNMKLLPH